MVINIDFDFVEKVNDIKYTTLVDVMSKLGGFKASFAPILSFIAPLFALHFFWKLSGIIDEKMGVNQSMEMF